MLETSIFPLCFSYINACQSYRFVITKNKKQTKTFWILRLNEALCKESKLWINEGPQNALYFPGGGTEDEIPIHFLGNPCGALPSSWCFLPHDELQVGIVPNGRDAS